MRQQILGNLGVNHQRIDESVAHAGQRSLRFIGARCDQTDSPLCRTHIAQNLKIRLRADKKLSIETVRDVTLELQGLEQRLNSQREPARRLKFEIVGEVSEPKEP